jgi:hypothetical protein
VEWLNDFAVWAWARHHNILSWYIRPLFFLPFCYFAHRRSWSGMVLTVIALMSSVFWFPAPAQPDPRVIAMLDAERDYLTGAWTWWKLAFGLLVPGTFILVGMAFWKRSLWYGIAVINAMVLFKIGWTFAFAPPEGALAHLLPVTIGLIICDIVLVAAVRKMRGRLSLKPAS